MSFCTIENLLILERRGLLATRRTQIITDNDRKTGIIFILKLVSKFNIDQNTLLTALDIFDIYTTKNTKNILLASITSLVLATKKEDISYLDIDDLDIFFDSDKIINMEQDIFQTLHGDFNIISFITFLSLIPMSKEEYDFCVFLGKLIMIYIPGLYLPSVIACTVYHLSSGSIPQKIDIPISIIGHCADALCNLLRSKLTLRSVNNSLDNELDLLLIETSAFNKFYNLSKINMNGELDEKYTRNIGDWNHTTLMKDKIQKLKTLGEGSYSKVYKVRYSSSMIYAMKKGHKEQEGLSFSYIREISILTVTNHKNIISLKGINPDNEQLFMECMNMDLNTYIHDNPSQNIQIKITKDLCEGLAYLHDLGIMHRDIKPGNILISGVNDNITAKYADFGISRMITSGKNISDGVCTLWYRPPEVLLGDKYDQRVDIWALGCSLYQMFTRKPLFPGDSEIDQLFKIFRCFGTPNENTWPNITNYPGYSDSWPKWNPKPSIWTEEQVINMGCKLLVEHCLIMNVSSEGNEPKRIYSKNLLPLLLDNNYETKIIIKPSNGVVSKVEIVRTIKSYLDNIDIESCFDIKTNLCCDMFDYIGSDQCRSFVEEQQKFKTECINKYKQLTHDIPNLTTMIKASTKIYFESCI